MLVLAAREDQVTGENAGRIQARLISEGANGPTSVEADEILVERGILVLPDVLTNAGGVTVSYFEWVQDLGRLFWGRDEIRHKLTDQLGDAFDRVWELSDSRRSACAARRSSRRFATSPQRSRRPGSSVSDRVRDAMVVDPPVLERNDSAQAAGESLTRPEVRAVFVSENGRFVGVITRKTLVREVVAAGRDPLATPVGEIAEPPVATIGSDRGLDEAFQFLEERDLERVPVVENGRLVGVLSRSVLRRRLAEDDPPPVELEELCLAAGVRARRRVALFGSAGSSAASSATPCSRSCSLTSRPSRPK